LHSDDERPKRTHPRQRPARRSFGSVGWLGSTHPRIRRRIGDAAVVGRPARGEPGPSLFPIELAGRYKGVKLQIVAIDKFALESHVVSVAQTTETLYLDRTSAVWKRYGNYLP